MRLWERLGVSESEFYRADPQRQMRWLAYELVRQAEEARYRGLP